MNKINKTVRYATLCLVFVSIVISVPAQSKEKKKKHSKNESTLSYQEQVTNSSLFIEAVAQRLQGNAEKAQELFDKCVSVDPNNDAALYELAQIYCEKNNWQQGKEMAEKAVELSPENIWYKQVLVSIYQNTDQLGDAIELSEKIAKQYPENLENLLQLSSLYMTDRKYDDAIKALDKIEATTGVVEDISIQKQRIYFEQGKTDKAIAEIQKLANESLDNDKSRYLSMIAEIYMQKKQPDKALDIYKQIAEIDPNNKYIHVSLADYYRQKGDTESSLKELRTGFENPALDLETKLRVLFTYYSPQEIYTSQKANAIELTQILVKTHPKASQPHSLLGDLYMHSEQFDDASKELQQALEADSSKYIVWESLLQCHAALQNWTPLLNESQRASELFPLIPMPYLYQGFALMELKQTNDAINVLNRGAKLVFGNDMLSAQFYSSLGDAYNLTKQYKLSDDSYDKALKLNTENPLALNNYAYYLSLRGENLDKAEMMAKKATELDPKNSANMDTYAWVLFKQKKYDQAKIWIEKAMNTLQKDDPDLLEHYGDILFKLGEQSKALENWQKALNMGSKSEQLSEKIHQKKLVE